MSTSVLLLRALVAALEQVGIPRDGFLGSAGIDPSKLDQIDQRLELEELDAAYEVALRLTGNDSFGLYMGERLSSGDYNLVSHLVAHAKTLRSAIDSLLGYHQLVTDRPCWRLIEENRSAILLYDAGGGSPKARRFRAELTMSGFYLLLKNFEPRGRPSLVSFDYDPPSYRAQYTRIFEGAELFAQPFIGIRFDRKLLRSVHVNADPELHAVIVAHAEKRVARLVKTTSYSQRVRRYLLDGALPPRHDMEVVARALGMSARSLRRRLRAEGAPFRHVIDEALGALAKRLILEEDRPIEAVAYAMGFSHPTAFHRAFKRWTGATPAVFRASRRRDELREDTEALSHRASRETPQRDAVVTIARRSSR